MKCDVLLAREQIQHRARHPGKPVEIGDRGRVHIDPAETAELRLHIANAGFTAIESLCTSTKPAEKMEMGNLSNLW